MESKTCSKCKKRKDLAAFSRSKRAKDGHRGECKGCISQYYRDNSANICQQVSQYRRKYPKKIKELYIKGRYGLTIEQYNNILAKQNNRCAVSGQKFGTGNKAPVIDHDHALGHVRGIIQSRFNLAEGILKHPEDTLALYNYMMKNELFYGLPRKTDS